GDGTTVRQVASSPSGRLTAVGTDERIFVMETATARRLGSMECQSTRMTAIAFSPCQRYLAAIFAADLVVWIWDLDQLHGKLPDVSSAKARARCWEELQGNNT